MIYRDISFWYYLFYVIHWQSAMSRFHCQCFTFPSAKNKLSEIENFCSGINGRLSMPGAILVSFQKHLPKWLLRTTSIFCHHVAISNTVPFTNGKNILHAHCLVSKLLVKKIRENFLLWKFYVLQYFTLHVAIDVSKINVISHVVRKGTWSAALQVDFLSDTVVFSDTLNTNVKFLIYSGNI